MARRRRTGRVHGTVWLIAGVAWAGFLGLYLVSYVATGGHPFQHEMSPTGAHAQTAARTSTRRAKHVAHAKVQVAPRCHVTLTVQSVADSTEKAQKCRRLRLANGVVVTVQHVHP
jgi:hypothetical protein